MARPNAEAFLAQQGMKECMTHLETWLKRLTDEQKTERVNEFITEFNAVWEKLKEHTATYPFSHEVARDVYIEHLTNIQRMLKACEKYREDLPARTQAILFEFQLEYEYAFAQPYHLHHERDRKHGELARTRHS